MVLWVFKVRLVVNTSESVAIWLFEHCIVVFKFAF